MHSHNPILKLQCKWAFSLSEVSYHAALLHIFIEPHSSSNSKIFFFLIICYAPSKSPTSAIFLPFQLDYHLSLPPLPQPPFSKSNPLSTQDTISRPALIAGSRFFMRTAILLRGGKTMEANSVSIDQPVSLSSLQPSVFTVPVQRSDMSEDLVAPVPVLASAGRISVHTEMRSSCK